MESVREWLADGSDHGDGCGYGYGSGYGSGDGYGSGYGSGDIKTFNAQRVYEIDGVATLIGRIKGNVAQGRVLRRDLTTAPCYVVKGNGMFAHGETLAEARDALREKMLENMPVDERIAAFWKEFDLGQKYPARLFYDWHRRLTGSCEMGRQEFARNHGINVDTAEYTPEEFIELIRNDYGGKIIRQLAEAKNIE